MPMARRGDMFDGMRRDARFAAIAAVLLAVWLWVCVRPSIDGDFVYDDTSLIRDNARIAKFSIPRAREWFGQTLLGPEEATRYYRPLLLAAFALDRQMWNLDARAFHLLNLFWYWLGAVAAGALAWRLGWSRWAAAASAFLFAVQPLHAQAVCYMSGRGDVQYLALALLALHAALSAWRSSRASWAWNLAAGILFAAAMLTKEMAALALPWAILMALLARAPRRDFMRSVIVLAATLIGVVALRMHAAPAGSGGPGAFYPIGETAKLFARAAGFYASNWILPFRLALDRTLVPGTQENSFYGWLGLVVLPAAIAVTAWAWKNRENSDDRRLLFALAWTGVAFLAASNLIRLSATAADHWALPMSVGLCWAVACLGQKIWETRPSRRLLLSIVGALIFVTWSGQLRARSLDWSNGLALYQANLEAGVVSTRVLNNYALELSLSHQNEDALRYVDEALRLEPNNLSARANRAVILDRLGGHDRALDEVRALAREHPHYEQVWVAYLVIVRKDPAQFQTIGREALSQGEEFPRVRALLRSPPRR